MFEYTSFHEFNCWTKDQSSFTVMSVCVTEGLKFKHQANFFLVKGNFKVTKIQC